MRFSTQVICFLVVLSAGFSAAAQSNIKDKGEVIWERYTKAWVERDKDYTEEKEVKADKVLAKLKNAGVQLYIPQNPDTTRPNGDKYIKAFLINNSTDSVSLDRIDATIAVQTEIRIDGKWKLFQKNMGSSCGNSYYKRKLPAKKYLSLIIEIRDGGSIKVPYRSIVYVNNKQIISNETEIYVTPKLIELAGTPIKSISL